MAQGPGQLPNPPHIGSQGPDRRLVVEHAQQVAPHPGLGRTGAEGSVKVSTTYWRMAASSGPPGAALPGGSRGDDGDTTAVQRGGQYAAPLLASAAVSAVVDGVHAA